MLGCFCERRGAAGGLESSHKDGGRSPPWELARLMSGQSLYQESGGLVRKPRTERGAGGTTMLSIPTARMSPVTATGAVLAE